MSIASTSRAIRDQFSTHCQPMPHVADRFLNDHFSSRCFNADFDEDPDRSSTFSVFVEGLQDQFSGTASDLEKRRYPDSIDLSYGTSALSTEIGDVSQGNVASYAVSEPLSSGREHAASSDFDSFSFNEAYSWEDILLHAQEKATPVLLHPRKGWIESSTSCTTSGDTMSNTVSIEIGRPLLQRSYSIPTYTEASADEEQNHECRPPLQHNQSMLNHSPQPVALNASAPLSIYHGLARTDESDAVLPLSTSSEAETRERTMLPSLRPPTSRESRFPFQTMMKDKVQDSAVVQDFQDTVDFLVVSGCEQHNSVQQAPRLSISRSPDLHGGRQREECGAELHSKGEDLNHLKLKSPAKPASKRYGRPGIVEGINLEHKGVDCNPARALYHVQRERKRRDLMAVSIAALERLLPKSHKRDRVAVLDDTILLLKKLERDVKILQQRFQEATLRKAAHKKSREPNRPSVPKSIDCNKEVNGIVIKRIGTHMKTVANCTQPTIMVTSERPTPTHLSSGTQCLRGSNIVKKGNVVVEFHVHLDDTVTVQAKILKCTCQMDYLKTMIGVVDEFHLDLTNCNIIKLSGYFICIVHLRAPTRADITSAAQFAARLQSVIDVGIAREAAAASLPGAKISEIIQK